MNREHQQLGVGVTKHTVGKYGQRMLYVRDNYKSSINVTFSECSAPGLPKKRGVDQLPGAPEAK